MQHAYTLTGLLPAWPLLSAFMAASVVLAITPGPGVMYIVARSATQGRSAGLASMGGVAFGNLGNAFGASIGLASLFAISATAFSVVKIAGGFYLIYLGVEALRRPATAAIAAPPPMPTSRIFRDGFVVALLNPKTAVFFAAFLPQFMVPHSSTILQSIALGALFVAIAAATDTLYALTAGTIGPTLSRAGAARRAGRFLGGGIFVGLGLFAVLSGSRAKT